MPKVVFNPMLKKGFQEIDDTSAEIARIEAKVTDVETLLQYLTKDNDGNYIISIPTKFLGNVTVQGTQTIIKTQQIESENDFIILRDGNPLGLAAGAYSGFKIKNYDGNGNNCLLVVDKDGWARIGDESGTIQKIATIQENPTNGALVKYNTTTKQLESTTINNATQSAAGLMSAADKTKLDGININGNFVKKFSDTAAASLQNGDIGQYQGTTTEELMRGFFYEKSNTIPANTWYLQILNDCYVDETKIINKGNYIYNSGETFSLTTEYVTKYHNNEQPMLYYIKNPAVGDSAVIFNFSTNTLQNTIITDISNGTITAGGTTFNGTEYSRVTGTLNKFINSDNDVIYLPYYAIDGQTVDGSQVSQICVAVINGRYNVFAPYASPFTIYKSNGDAGGTLTPVDYSKTKIAFTDETGSYSDVPPAADLPQNNWTIAQIIARIKKIEGSLKKIAFSGSYKDLSNKNVLISGSGGNGTWGIYIFNESGYHCYRVFATVGLSSFECAVSTSGNANSKYMEIGAIFNNNNDWDYSWNVQGTFSLTYRDGYAYFVEVTKIV